MKMGVQNNAASKIIGQVDFSSQPEMTCNETDGARKFRRWRYYRPTWPHLEVPSRLTRPDLQVYLYPPVIIGLPVMVSASLSSAAVESPVLIESLTEFD